MFLLTVEDVKNITYMLIVISVAVGVFIYFISKFLQDKRLEQMAKSNLIEAITTTLIVSVLFIGFLPLLNQISVEMAQTFLANSNSVNPMLPLPPDYDLVDVTILAMKQGPFNCLINMRTFLMGIYMYFFGASNANTNFLFLESTGSGASIYDYAFQNFIGLILYLELMYFLIFKVLIYFKYILFKILFPIGVALRTMDFTRGVGGFLMALSLSFYIVFPFVYLFTLTLFPIQGECAPQINNFENSCDITDMFSGQVSILRGLSMFKTYSGLFLTQGIDEFLRQISLSVCLFPFIAFGVSMTTTNIGSTLFGAKIPEISRGIIKFI